MDTVPTDACKLRLQVTELISREIGDGQLLTAALLLIGSMPTKKEAIELLTAVIQRSKEAGLDINRLMFDSIEKCHDLLLGEKREEVIDEAFQLLKVLRLPGFTFKVYARGDLLWQTVENLPEMKLLQRFVDADNDPVRCENGM